MYTGDAIPVSNVKMFPFFSEETFQPSSASLRRRPPSRSFLVSPLYSIREFPDPVISDGADSFAVREGGSLVEVKAAGGWMG